MKTTLEYVRKLTEEKHGDLKSNIFYNILDLNLNIETIEGYYPIKSFVIKTGKQTLVKFESGDGIECSDVHFFMTEHGKLFAYELEKGIRVISRYGYEIVSSVEISENHIDVYDIEVKSSDHTFLTANGICHHNTGKTQTVEDELAKRGLTDGEGYFKITGSASTAGIYRILYEHRKDIILFDDSDGALADQDSRNLFKAASDTKKVRKISWMKASKNYVDPADMEDGESADPDKLPRYFDFTGKIIFISNLGINKLDPDGALRTRGFVVVIDPTDEEVYKFMSKIVTKIHLDVDYTLTPAQGQEVIDILKGRKLREGSVNLRSLVRGLNTMAAMLREGSNDYARMILRYS